MWITRNNKNKKYIVDNIRNSAYIVTVDNLDKIEEAQGLEVKAIENERLIINRVNIKVIIKKI